MANPIWCWVTFADKAKPHLCPKSLVALLLRDMRGRGCDQHGEKVVDKISIDMPGVCRVDRPVESLTFAGLAVHVPSEDVLPFANQLQSLSPRLFVDKYGNEIPYYKLHAFHRCWVLAPRHKDRLLAAFRARASAAETRARAFYADKAVPSVLLREASAAALGTPLEEVPDLGGHHLDRFLRKR